MENQRTTDLVAQDVVEYQKRVYLPPDKYIVETEMETGNRTMKRKGKDVRVWARTVIYNAQKCKTSLPVCFAERRYPANAGILTCDSPTKQEAVAIHKAFCDLLNAGYTPQEINKNKELRRRVLTFVAQNANNETFKNLRSVRELLIKDMQRTSKHPKEILNKEIGKIRNVLMQETVKDKNWIPGTLVITPYLVKTYLLLDTPKEEPRKFYTTVTDLTTKTEIKRIESFNKPQSKRMHKLACELVKEKGRAIIYETLRDDFTPRRKGIHPPQVKDHGLESR